jgi:hypothetical protein
MQKEFGAGFSVDRKSDACTAVASARLYSGVDAEFHKPFDTGFFGLVQLGQRILKIAALLAQFFALFLNALDHKVELPDLAGRLLVHLDDFADFADGEAKPLAA